MFTAFKTRRPWATVVICLFLGPMIGMFYLGKGRVGLAYLLLMLCVMAAAILGIQAGFVHLEPHIAVRVFQYAVILPGCHGLRQRRGTQHGTLRHGGAASLPLHVELSPGAAGPRAQRPGLSGISAEVSDSAVLPVDSFTGAAGELNHGNQPNPGRNSNRVRSMGPRTRSHETLIAE